MKLHGYIGGNRTPCGILAEPSLLAVNLESITCKNCLPHPAPLLPPLPPTALDVSTASHGTQRITTANEGTAPALDARDADPPPTPSQPIPLETIPWEDIRSHDERVNRRDH